MDAMVVDGWLLALPVMPKVCIADDSLIFVGNDG